MFSGNKQKSLYRQKSMRRRLITIKNQAGIHCRPSSVILTTIQQEFPDHLFELKTGDKITELSSILALISLGLAKGTEVILQVTGEKEEEAIDRIGNLFESDFDFPPR
jgi:phosphocarrier protein